MLWTPLTKTNTNNANKTCAFLQITGVLNYSIRLWNCSDNVVILFLVFYHIQ